MWQIAEKDSNLQEKWQNIYVLYCISLYPVFLLVIYGVLLLTENFCFTVYAKLYGPEYFL